MRLHPRMREAALQLVEAYYSVRKPLNINEHPCAAQRVGFKCCPLCVAADSLSAIFLSRCDYCIYLVHPKFDGCKSMLARKTYMAVVHNWTKAEDFVAACWDRARLIEEILEELEE